MARLTKTVVDHASPRERPFFIWCDELQGFGCRIFPSGRRVYYADYTPPTGTRKRLSLGPHGKLTTEEARKLALKTLGGVLKGDDPALDRAAQRKAITVRELTERYFTAADEGLILGKKGGPKKASTLLNDRSRVARHVLPLLGSRKVADLTTADISRFMRDVAGGKTAVTEKTSKLRGKAVVEGGRGAASRTVGLLGGILSFAVEEGVIASNPARGVKRPADGRRTARLDADGYAALGRALAAWDARRESSVAANAVRLIALTGCRSGEVLNLRWTEVDADGHALRLIDSKEGRSTRPLGQAALDVLASVERVHGNPWVFQGRTPDAPYGGLPTAWARLMKEAGLPRTTPHTLRHSFASVAGDLGYSESTIAALLGHAAGSVTGRYVHHLDAVLIAAADKVAATIFEQMKVSTDPSRKAVGHD